MFKDEIPGLPCPRLPWSFYPFGPFDSDRIVQINSQDRPGLSGLSLSVIVTLSSFPPQVSLQDR